MTSARAVVVITTLLCLSMVIRDSTSVTTLDLDQWTPDVTAWGGGNNEFELYTPDPANSYNKDGVLFIKPTLLATSINPKTGQPFGANFMNDGVLNVTEIYGICTNANNGGCYRTGAQQNIPPVISTSLRSKFSYKFVKVVIRAKLPVGDWLWPAIWLLPVNNVYGPWPRSGEIDIAESRGNANYTCNGVKVGIQQFGSTLHWGTSYSDDHYWKTTAIKRNERCNFGQNFHDFILEWTAEGITFSIDGVDKTVLQVPNPPICRNPSWSGFWNYGKPWSTNDNPWAVGSNLAPFDQEFYFILNVAVGGTNGFIPDGCINGNDSPANQKPWLNSDAYIKAMQKFFNARDAWLPTWTSEGDDNNAMQIASFDIYQ